MRRGEDRAAVLRRMMDARDQLLARLWAAAARRTCRTDARGGGDPGLDRREGDRPAGRAARAWPRSSSTACRQGMRLAEPIRP